MHTTRDGTDQSRKKQAEELYYTYINLGVEAQKKEEYVLAESYYQQAEYYLHCITEKDPFSLDSFAAKKIMKRDAKKKPLLKKPSDAKASNTQVGRKQHNARTEPFPPNHQAVIIPFKPNFLRRKRWETPSNQEDASSKNET